jgi:hypothetical protein
VLYILGRGQGKVGILFEMACQFSGPPQVTLPTTMYCKACQTHNQRENLYCDVQSVHCPGMEISVGIL